MPLAALPDLVLAAMFVIPASVVSVAGLLLFRRLVPRSTVAQHHSAAADTFNMIALLYAVILGSLVASAWTRFTDAEASANAEAGHLGDLFRYADGFEEPLRSDLLGDLLTYARSVVDEEWPRLGSGARPAIGSAAYDDLWARYRTIEPATEHDLLYLRGSLEHLTGLGEQRGLRAVFAETRLAPALWILFLAGGAIAIFFTYFFSEAPGALVQSVLVGLLAGLFGFVLFLLLTLEFPYSGDVRVQPHGFEDLIDLWQGAVH